MAGSVGGTVWFFARRDRACSRSVKNDDGIAKGVLIGLLLFAVLISLYQASQPV